MTNYNLDLKFLVTGHESIEQLEDHLDKVLDHLADLDGIEDPDLTASLATGDVTFSLFVDAASQPEALRDGLAAVRTAIHACDGGTPAWDALFRDVEATIRASDDLVDA